MKSKLKYLLFAAFAAGIFTGCDDDTSLPPYQPLDVAQDFAGVDNTTLSIDQWTNYNEVGNALWMIQVYSGNGYAEFNPYQSGDVSNVGWLISPKIVLEENNTKVLRFQVSQSYVSSAANKIEVLVSTDFDGTNVTAATWTPVEANLPGIDATYFEFQDSGEISLTPFAGDAYVAFKVTGSGTNTALDGAYQVDSFRVYTK